MLSHAGVSFCLASDTGSFEVLAIVPPVLAHKSLFLSKNDAVFGRTLFRAAVGMKADCPSRMPKRGSFETKKGKVLLLPILPCQCSSMFRPTR